MYVDNEGMQLASTDLGCAKTKLIVHRYLVTEIYTRKCEGTFTKESRSLRSIS